MDGDTLDGGRTSAEQALFARAVARRAEELGLTYTTPDGRKGIPVALPRAAEAAEQLVERAGLAALATSALVKVGAAAVRGGLGEGARTALLDGLSTLEREAIAVGVSVLPRLATVRADMVVDEHGAARLLEVNTTIPAMQGYSDIALRAYVETALAHEGAMSQADARRVAGDLLADEGTNADALVDALVGAYRRDGGTARTPTIALVHRAGDAQHGELAYLAERFTKRGFAARTIVVDELAMQGDRIVVGALAPDILYRHVFARLVPEASAFAAALRSPAAFKMYNPVAAHLEQKAALALLSEVADDAQRARGLGLMDDERVAVVRAVPWTRILTAEHVAAVQDAPRRFVVKRSAGYGGLRVFLGAEHDADDPRVVACFGRAMPWRELVQACAEDGAFVVQERVVLRSSPAVVATASFAEERALFTDACVFTAFGTTLPATGAVRRASTSPIVNIQTGGGVMPVVTTRLRAAMDKAIATARI